MKDYKTNNKKYHNESTALELLCVCVCVCVAGMGGGGWSGGGGRGLRLALKEPNVKVPWHHEVKLWVLDKNRKCHSKGKFLLDMLNE